MPLCKNNARTCQPDIEHWTFDFVLKKKPEPNSLRMSGPGLYDISAVLSADKHLILSVGLINGLRNRRYENFEAATEARHNRCQFASRLYHFTLNEIGGVHDLRMRSIDCSADHLYFVAGVNGGLTNHDLKLADFIFDDRQGLREVLGRCREMS